MNRVSFDAYIKTLEPKELQLELQICQHLRGSNNDDEIIINENDAQITFIESVLTARIQRLKHEILKRTLTGEPNEQ
jgi:hypothetical protein